MKRIVILIQLVTLLVASVTGQAQDRSNGKGLNRLINSQADRIISSYIDRKALAGAVALLAKDGEIFYHKAFGMQNIEGNHEMKLNSLFQIASMTKPITTVALLILMEEGKLKLDDPITLYLPEYRNLMVEQADGSRVRPNTQLTLMHFLTHTSGLPGGGHPDFKAKVDMSKITSLKEYVDAFTVLPLVHQPGEKFTYGLNTNVIGRVVEIVSGQPFEVFIKKRIFDPLKMESTYFFIPEEDLDRFCSLYKPGDGRLTLVQGPTTHPVKFAMGNGGLTSSASDYFRFAQMLVNGGELDGVRLLKKETVQLMTRNHLPEKILPLNVMGTIFPNNGFGLGVAVVGQAPGWTPAALKFSNMGNLPAGSFFWPGVTNTYWWGDPSNGIVGILLTQSTDPSATTIFQEFHHVVYNSIYGALHIDGAVQPVQTLTGEERSFLIDHLTNHHDELESMIKGLSKKQLNFKFDPNRWSIMECLEHIAVTEKSLWDWAIAGLDERANPGRRSEVRANEKMIIARLSDRVNKLEAPQEVRPTGKYKKAKDAMRDYNARRAATIEFVKSTQDDLRNHFVKHHVAGTIDVYMALVLLSAHQGRHNMQIREIMEAVGFPKK